MISLKRVRIRVTVYEAQLIDTLVDPYIVLIEGPDEKTLMKHRSPLALNGGKTPKWNWTNDFLVNSLDEELRFQVKNNGDTLSDDFACEGQQQLSNMLGQSVKNKKEWYRVTDKDGKDAGKVLLEV